MTPLSESDLAEVAEAIRSLPEIKAVAVCFLFSYLNPAHEQRAKAILSAHLDDLPISTSFEVLPKWKEYERASTTLADAYLKPVVSSQLWSMRERLDKAGVRAPSVVIKSNGGEMTLEAAARAPVNLAMSGPTGGVIASRYLAQLSGIDNLVTLDMGGTSTDVATILDQQESFTTAFEIEWGLPIQIPMLDIRTIGAGGGSIAWIDTGGMLRVGPQSAGAKPGPACYGAGGVDATVTDANVVLGRIDPNNFLNGRMKLDTGAAEAAIDRVAKAIGQTRDDTALAIVRIANNNMVGRAPLGADRARPRSARFHALHVRRRGAAACVGTDGRGGHSARHHPDAPGPVLRLRLHRHQRARRPSAHDAADEPSTSTQRARRRSWRTWSRRASAN